MTQTVNITRRRGDTYPEPFALVDQDGAAINLTGASLVLTVDPSPAPADASRNVASITGTVTSAVGGLVQFAPSSGEADLSPAVYHYDVQLTDSGGAVRTVCAGKWEIVQDVSK